MTLILRASVFFQLVGVKGSRMSPRPLSGKIMRRAIMAKALGKETIDLSVLIRAVITCTPSFASLYLII